MNEFENNVPEFAENYPKAAQDVTPAPAEAQPQAQPQPQTQAQAQPQAADSGYYHYAGNPTQQNGYYNPQPAAPQQTYNQAWQQPQPQGYYTAPQQGYQVPPAYGAPAGGQGNPPQPPYPPQQPQAQPQPQQPEAAKKKSSKKPAIIAAAIVIVLAIIGIVAVTATNSHGNTEDSSKEPTMQASSAEEAGSSAESQSSEASEAEAEDETTETADAEDENENINTTVLDVTSNSTSSDLTPQDVYEQYVNAVVAISNESTTTNVFGQSATSASSGSGMIIDSDGYILTNNHVVEGAETLTVILTSGEEYDATIIGADSENDVALIKIDATDLPTVPIGDSDNMAVGEQVCAIGNPLGELTNTLTVGYVSALDREIAEDSTTIINMFQTDCAINAGNSGGPLFDMNGNVIGITTAKYSSSSLTSSASIEGIGFCIPINDAMDIVSDLLEYGYVRGRAALGITCQTISSTVTEYYNLPTGVYVTAVSEGSAAENAGIQEGDIICSLNGEETTSVADLKALLKDYTAGDTVTLNIYRSGETMDVDVTLDESVSTASTETETQTDESQSGAQGSTQQIPGFSGMPGF